MYRNHRVFLAPLLTFLFVILLASTSDAQKPSGFLGKRSIVEVDLSYNPILLFFQEDSEFSEKRLTMKIPVGIGGSYRYAISSRSTVGLSVMYHTYGKPTVQSRVENNIEYDKATTEFTAVVELQMHGSKLVKGMAPLGGAMQYGLGVTQISGTPDNINRRLAGETGSIMSPVFRVGYAYRYIFKEKISFTPWSRVDLSSLTFNSLRSTPFDEESEDPILPSTLPVTWRIGVSVGLVL